MDGLSASCRGRDAGQLGGQLGTWPPKLLVGFLRMNSCDKPRSEPSLHGLVLRSFSCLVPLEGSDFCQVVQKKGFDACSHTLSVHGLGEQWRGAWKAGLTAVSNRSPAGGW